MMNDQKTTAETDKAGAYKVRDDAPDYWKRDGGAHIEVTTDLGVGASALRSNSEMPWCAYRPGYYETQLDATLTTEEVTRLLKSWIKEAIRRLVAQIDAEAKEWVQSGKATPQEVAEAEAAEYLVLVPAGWPTACPVCHRRIPMTAWCSRCELNHTPGRTRFVIRSKKTGKTFFRLVEDGYDWCMAGEGEREFNSRAEAEAFAKDDTWTAKMWEDGTIEVVEAQDVETVEL
jgi:hypothetical protein